MSQPYEGATPEQLEHHLVRHFLEIHAMFRNQLAVMLDYVAELIDGEQQLGGSETRMRIQALIRAGAQYSQLLHFHHHGETSIMFPALEEEGLDTAVVARLNREHDEIAALIDQFSRAIRDFSTIEPQVMNNDLRRLAEALQAHLAYEETHVCPLLTRWSHFPGFH